MNNIEKGIDMEERTTACEHCKRTRERSPEERQSLSNRLKRIEGQIRGIIRMLEEDAYCVDILTQVSAVSSALSGFSRELLSSHIKGCVSEEIRQGRSESVDELVEVVARFMK